MYSKNIAVTIRELRMQKNISKKQMAELLHCSYSAYCRMEAGETELISQKLTKTVSILNVDIIKLVCGALKKDPVEEQEENKQEASAMDQQAADAMLKIKDETIAVLKDRVADLKQQLNIKDTHIERLLSYRYSI